MIQKITWKGEEKWNNIILFYFFALETMKLKVHRMDQHSAGKNRSVVGHVQSFNLFKCIEQSVK